MLFNSFRDNPRFYLLKKAGTSPVPVHSISFLPLFSFIPLFLRGLIAAQVGVFFGKIERMEKGKLLRELRSYLKISVRDFAAKIGVAPTTIYWYENGGTLTESIIEEICRAFNVEKEYFKGTMTLEDAVNYTGYNHQRIERIREAMNEKGIMTNKDLSKRSGVSTTRLSDIMTEKNMLTEDKARKIANALEVGVDWILYGEERKKEFPVNREMIYWLWSHPEERELLYQKTKNK